tara:strand:+ start:204 stop:623 length:420 start_codon:yes stop_codon:yes gene_type:complete
MNNSKQTTDKNNCIIFGNSDISNFIIESLLNSNNNYNITFLSEDPLNTKFSNEINILNENIYDPKILKNLDFPNTKLSICCSQNTNLNILTASYMKSLKAENIFCCSYDTQYNNLLNSQNIITFNPWNIPNKLNSFWRN